MKKLVIPVLTMTFIVSLTLSAADFGAKGALKADNLTLSDMLTYAIQDEYVIIPQDIKTSLELGVNAEIDNIAMYEAFLERELPADVRDVFEQLKRASENHLRAFQNNLRKYR
jgi:hypothetical protein